MYNIYVYIEREIDIDIHMHVCMAKYIKLEVKTDSKDKVIQMFSNQGFNIFNTPVNNLKYLVTKSF